jgi:hypothetical protein
MIPGPMPAATRLRGTEMFAMSDSELKLAELIDSGDKIEWNWNNCNVWARIYNKGFAVGGHTLTKNGKLAIAINKALKS